MSRALPAEARAADAELRAMQAGCTSTGARAKSSGRGVRTKDKESPKEGGANAPGASDALSVPLRFRIEGKCCPAVRMTQRTKFGPAAQRYLTYRGEVAARAKEALAGAGPATGPVAIHILIAAKGRRFDLDNACKAILDGMNQVVYVDDRQVVRINAEVRDGVFEYAHVTVTKGRA
jgi:crossover junction endodeoxyribonuclease RusA